MTLRYATQFWLNEPVSNEERAIGLSEAIALAYDFPESQSDLLEKIARNIQEGRITPPHSITFEAKATLQSGILTAVLDSQRIEGKR